MKKLIAVVAVMFSAEAFPFDGTANEYINGWKKSLQFLTEGYEGFANSDFMDLMRVQGFVSGVSTIFSSSNYPYPICYPEGSNVRQVHTVAAKYVMAHPEKWNERNAVLVWEAHYEAWGPRDVPECWIYELDNSTNESP